MTDEQRKFARLLYQSMATPEEKELYLAAVKGTYKDRWEYLRDHASKYGLSLTQMDDFMRMGFISKEDQAFIMGQMARGFIIKALSWFAGLFR